MDAAPVLPPTCPLFRNIHHRQIQHFQQTVVRRENALGFCDLPQHSSPCSGERCRSPRILFLLYKNMEDHSLRRKHIGCIIKISLISLQHNILCCKSRHGGIVYDLPEMWSNASGWYKILRQLRYAVDSFAGCASEHCQGSPESSGANTHGRDGDCPPGYGSCGPETTQC